MVNAGKVGISPRCRCHFHCHFWLQRCLFYCCWCNGVANLILQNVPESRDRREKHRKSRPDREIWTALFGGGGGNRTPVRKQLDRNFSGRSLLFTFPQPAGNKHPAGIGSFMMHGTGKAYRTHGHHSNHTRARLVVLPGRMGGLIRLPEQRSRCQLILKSCPFYRGQAPRPAIPASLPPSKPVRPHIRRGRGRSWKGWGEKPPSLNRFQMAAYAAAGRTVPESWLPALGSGPVTDVQAPALEFRIRNRPHQTNTG